VLLSLDLHLLNQREEFRLEKNLVDFNENFSFLLFGKLKTTSLFRYCEAKALEQLAKNETAGLYTPAEIEKHSKFIIRYHIIFSFVYYKMKKPELSLRIFRYNYIYN
jgi:hypothetical protein